MDERLISDISTTNKDFQSIYTELLDLAKKLTNKWDPSLSNESDPGVILLKICALIADKNNYNIDKNILECFPLSVTQEGNARKLYDMLGYNMHWYKSATTKLGFQIKKADSIPVDTYTIDQFQAITDASGETVYTIVNKVFLLTSLVDTVFEVNAIQGKVLQYTINGESLITTNNLDTNNRLYFQDSMIAENGIFIADAGNGDITADTATYTGELTEGTIWKRVSNLASQPLGEKVYTFGVLPNSSTCYIEFPQDIASLMSQGIYLKYTVTQGEAGNIKFNTLTQFFEDQVIDTGDEETGSVVINDFIRIYQNQSATNGADPETIDSAYKNFKRTIGTFDTLVTERDYENFIYKLEGENKPLVSNINVSDRTNDINYSDFVQVYKPYGSRKELILKQKINSENVTSPVMNAYNITLYPLFQPLAVTDKKTYNQTFLPEFSNDAITDILDEMEDSRSVQHDIKPIYSSDLPSTQSEGLKTSLVDGLKKFLITNTFPLTGSLVTYSKISKIEAVSIENNVLAALYKAYSSRELIFGEAPDYDKLVSIIERADSRIKNVILNIPSYSPEYVLIENNTSTTIKSPYGEDKDNLNNELIARMILSGNVQLFKFDTDFNYDFGQSEGSVVSEGVNEVIKSITSESKIDVTSEEKQVRANEVIQVLKPSFVTTKEYSTYVRYYYATKTTTTTFNTASELKQYMDDNELTVLFLNYKINNTTEPTTATISKGELSISGFSWGENGMLQTRVAGQLVDTPVYFMKSDDIIPANQDYKLPEGTALYLAYVDSTTKAKKIDVIEAGEVVRSSIKIDTKPLESVTINKDIILDYYDDNNSLPALASGETIQLRQINRAELKSGTKYYFIVNNPTNRLVIKPDEPKVLQENEYFIYTNATTDELIILGSGTQLSIGSGEKDLDVELELIDYDKITADNIANINWLSLTQTLYVTELEIITLGENTSFKLQTLQGNPVSPDKNLTLDNIAQTFSDPTIKFVYGDEAVYASTASDTPVRIQSRLFIDANQVSPQQLLSGQSLTFELITVNENGEIIETIDPTFSSITETQVMFNNPVLLSGGVNLDAKVIDDYGQSVYSLKAYTFKEVNFSTDPDVKRDSDGLIVLKSATGESDTYTLNFTFAKKPADQSYLIPIYITASTPSDGNLKSVNIGNFSIFDPKNIISPGDIGAQSNTIINISSTISKAYIIQPPTGASGEGINSLSITLTGFTENDSVIIGNISKLAGYNTSEIDVRDLNHEYSLRTEDATTAKSNVIKILEYIDSIISDSNADFNWVYQVPEINKVVYPTSAESYWNPNHIYNKYILPKIDFNKTKIKVNPANII